MKSIAIAGLTLNTLGLLTSVAALQLNPGLDIGMEFTAFGVGLFSSAICLLEPTIRRLEGVARVKHLSTFVLFSVVAPVVAVFMALVQIEAPTLFRHDTAVVGYGVVTTSVHRTRPLLYQSA